MEKSRLDFRSFKKKESEIKNLLKTYPMSNYEECHQLLETMTFNEAMDHLCSKYHPKNKITPEIMKQIAEIKRVFPNMDDNLCLVYLEDYGYDLDEVFTSINRSKLLHELPKCKDKDPFQFLKQLYPSVDDDMIQAAINDSEDSLESAMAILDQIMIFNIYAESDYEYEDVRTIEEVIEGDGFNYDVDEDEYMHQVFPNIDIEIIRKCLKMFDNDLVDAVEFISNALNDGKDLSSLSTTVKPVPTFCPKKIEEPFLLPNNKETFKFISNNNNNKKPSNGVTVPHVPKNPKKKKMKSKSKPILLTAEEAIEQRLIKTKNDIKIDLHGLTLTVAYQVLKDVISIAKANKIRYVHLITGKGIHSNGNMPILRPYLLDVCRLEGIKASLDSRNSGEIKCIIK